MRDSSLAESGDAYGVRCCEGFEVHLVSPWLVVSPRATG